MADKKLSLQLSHVEAGDVVGKVVNVYDTYAHALAFGATGLVTAKAVDALTGVIGAEIAQTAKTAGPQIDVNGCLNIGVDDAADIYLMSTAGRWGGPLRIARAVLGYDAT